MALKRFAEMSEATFVALRTQGCAGVSAVKDEPMMCVGNLFVCEKAGEHLLNREWRLACVGNKTQSMADAEDVGIDCHACLAPYDAEYNVCSLAANSRKFSQLLQVLRHFSAILSPEHSSHFDKMLGLVVRVGDGANVVVDDFRTRQSHCFGTGIVLEEAGCDLIDAFVGTLCAKDDGHEQLEGIVVVQLRLCVWHSLFEVSRNLAI